MPTVEYATGANVYITSGGVIDLETNCGSEEDLCVVIAVGDLGAGLDATPSGWTEAYNRATGYGQFLYRIFTGAAVSDVTMDDASFGGGWCAYRNVDSVEVGAFQAQANVSATTPAHTFTNVPSANDRVLYMASDYQHYSHTYGAQAWADSPDGTWRHWYDTAQGSGIIGDRAGFGTDTEYAAQQCMNAGGAGPELTGAGTLLLIAKESFIPFRQQTTLRSM